jgi:hypothetical protein
MGNTDSMKNKIDISKLSIEELKYLRSDINNMIYNMDDGFVYHCTVRSYGSQWTETFSNFHAALELLNEFNGDNGIVDLYTTNTHIMDENPDFHMYGDLLLIESLEDYMKWFKWNKSMNYVKSNERDHKAFDDFIEQHGDVQQASWNGPRRPYMPHSTKEETAEDRAKLEAEKINIKFPVDPGDKASS